MNKWISKVKYYLNSFLEVGVLLLAVSVIAEVIFGPKVDTSNAIKCSGKTGEGVDDILESIIKNLPAPKGAQEEKLKSLLVDSWYDSYLGVVILVRIINGKIKKNFGLRNGAP